MEYPTIPTSSVSESPVLQDQSKTTLDHTQPEVSHNVSRVLPAQDIFHDPSYLIFKNQYYQDNQARFNEIHVNDSKIAESVITRKTVAAFRNDNMPLYEDYAHSGIVTIENPDHTTVVAPKEDPAVQDVENRIAERARTEINVPIGTDGYGDHFRLIKAQEYDRLVEHMSDEKVLVYAIVDSEIESAYKRLVLINQEQKLEEASQDSLYLWTTRPQSIVARIIKNSENEMKRQPHYLETGAQEYSFGPGQKINTDEIVETILREKKEDESIDILDVGTGDGAMPLEGYKRFGKRHEKIKFHGISLHNYRNTFYAEKSNENIDYQVGDAERIFTFPRNGTTEPLFREESLDAIVSRMTMRHLVDPLGTITQLYEALKPNGLLVLDQFNLPGLENSLPELIGYLQKGGYQIVSNYNYNSQGNKINISGINTFILRKTHPHLAIPVRYDTDEYHTSKARYVLTKDLPIHAIDLPYSVSTVINKLNDLEPKMKLSELGKESFLEDILNLDSQYLESDLVLEKWINKESLENLRLQKDSSIEEREKKREQNRMWLVRQQIPQMIVEWKQYKELDDQRFMEEVNERIKLVA